VVKYPDLRAALNKANNDLHQVALNFQAALASANTKSVSNEGVKTTTAGGNPWVNSAYGYKQHLKTRPLKKQRRETIQLRSRHQRKIMSKTKW
jgi:hypothetical protein